PSRRAGFEETPLESDKQIIAHAVPAIAGGGDHVPVVHDRDRILDRDHLFQDLPRCHALPPFAATLLAEWPRPRSPNTPPSVPSTRRPSRKPRSSSAAAPCSSSCRCTRQRGCTTTCASSATACSSRGPCRRGRPSILAKSASPCRPKIIPSATPPSKG